MTPPAAHLQQTEASMKYDVPVWVTVEAPDDETAWKLVSRLVNDALSVDEVLSWETGEPYEDDRDSD